MVDRRQKAVTKWSDVGEIIFSYMPHAPSPAVAIQTATQVAHMGRSFCMFLRSILIGENGYGILFPLASSQPFDALL